MEKDFWVCWALQQIAALEGQPRMIFKGGTSLSKVFGLIRRFSEDIDLASHRHDLGFSGERDPAVPEVSGKKRDLLVKELKDVADRHTSSTTPRGWEWTASRFSRPAEPQCSGHGPQPRLPHIGVLPNQAGPMDIRWDIRREGRSWTAEEFPSRVALRPEKLEVWEGKLLWSDEERLALLGLLLENVGADEAVKLGDPRVWAEAVIRRPRSPFSDPQGRELLALFLVTCLVTVGFAWLLRAVPVPSARAAGVLVGAGVALWATAAIHVLLGD